MKLNSTLTPTIVYLKKFAKKYKTSFPGKKLIKTQKYENEITRVKNLFSSLKIDWKGCEDNVLTLEPFESISIANFFILLSDNKRQAVCVDKDWLKSANDARMANWVKNPHSRHNIEERTGHGGMPGKKKYYPIDVFGYANKTYLDQASFNHLYSKYIKREKDAGFDPEHLSVYLVNKKEVVRLGNEKGEFGISMLHGQDVYQIYSITILE